MKKHKEIKTDRIRITTNRGGRKDQSWRRERNLSFSHLPQFCDSYRGHVLPPICLLGLLFQPLRSPVQFPHFLWFSLPCLLLFGLFTFIVWFLNHFLCFRLLDSFFSACVIIDHQSSQVNLLNFVIFLISSYLYYWCFFRCLFSFSYFLGVFIRVPFYYFAGFPFLHLLQQSVATSTEWPLLGFLSAFPESMFSFSVSVG